MVGTRWNIFITVIKHNRTRQFYIIIHIYRYVITEQNNKNVPITTS